MSLQHCILVLICFLLPKVYGQPAKGYKIVYGSAPWNTDSKQLDQAYMFVRDKNSGKTAKISIEETEPDSSIFSGNFSIDFKTDRPSDIEVYVPPENVRNSDNAVQKFNQLLNGKKVSPSPMVFKDENGVKVLDVYDTQEQVRRATKAYQDQVKKAKDAERTKNIKPVPNEQALAAAQLAEREQALAKLAKENADREAARIRMEQLEAQRLEQMRKEQERLSALEKKRRRDLAKQWSAKGIAAYQKGDFKMAEECFTKSVEFDPQNKDYYFMYGVSLYRNEKMNEALVALKISPSNAANDLEKHYYMGLIHYRLNEFSPAIAQFKYVKSVENAPLAPSAAFYEGVVHFTEENFEAAQGAFEWVLDHSQDPALDKKAEEYIERVAAALQAKKEAARKWQVAASAGLTYDSNILFSPDNETSQGSAADKGGIRAMLTGNADYRIFYTATREMSVKANTLYMYSLDSDFARADPFLSGASLPYTFKGTVKQRGYKLTLSPGAETLFMDADNEGTRKNILNSFYGNGDWTLIMSDSWFASYIFEVRKDDSNLTSQTGPNDLSAMKYTLKTQQVRLLDEAKKQALILQAGLIMNAAEGDNKTYQRIEGGVIYSAPWKKYQNTTWNTGLTAYKLDYPDSSDSRKDTNMALLLGMSKTVNPNWSWGLNSNYTNNTSSSSSNQYSKYSVMSTVNYNWSD